MGLADLPSELLQDVLFRAAKGETTDRVAELLSVCKFFCCKIKKCSINHATRATPDANQPLKLQDCAALKSLVVDKRMASLLTQHFAQSGTAVAVQALTSLTAMIPRIDMELWDAGWLEIESIINVAPDLEDVVLEYAPATLLTCLGSLHALTSLKFTDGRNCLPGTEDSDPSELMHSIMHLTALKDLYFERPFGFPCLRRLPDSISQLTALRVLSLLDCGLVGLPDSIGQLTALTMLDLRCVSEDNYFRSSLRLADSIGQLATLAILKLDGNEGLMALPDSIGHLAALKSLSLDHCTSLVRLPDSMGQLTALQDLNLGHCNGFAELPDIIGQIGRAHV